MRQEMPSTVTECDYTFFIFRVVPFTFFVHAVLKVALVSITSGVELRQTDVDVLKSHKAVMLVS